MPRTAVCARWRTRTRTRRDAGARQLGLLPHHSYSLASELLLELDTDAKAQRAHLGWPAALVRLDRALLSSPPPRSASPARKRDGRRSDSRNAAQRSQVAPVRRGGGLSVTAQPTGDLRTSRGGALRGLARGRRPDSHRAGREHLHHQCFRSVDLHWSPSRFPGSIAADPPRPLPPRRSSRLAASQSWELSGQSTTSPPAPPLSLSLSPSFLLLARLLDLPSSFDPPPSPAHRLHHARLDSPRSRRRGARHRRSRRRYVLLSLPPTLRPRRRTRRKRGKGLR